MLQEFLRGFLGLKRDQAREWGFRERRSRVRVQCSFRCLYGIREARLPATVVDIGEDGLRLATEVALIPGQKLTVYCPFVDVEGPSQAIVAEVRWTQPGGGKLIHFSGLHYSQAADECWVGPVLDLVGLGPQQRLSRRRWIRTRCNCPARCGEQSVEIQNLGVGGALLHSAEPLSPGSRELKVGPLEGLPEITLSCELRPFEGQHEGHYVACFSELEPANLENLSHYMKAFLRSSLGP